MCVHYDTPHDVGLCTNGHAPLLHDLTIATSTTTATSEAS